MKELHLKISKELYVIETLTKLQYCSEEATKFLSQDNAASPTQRVGCGTHTSYLRCNF